MLMSHCVAALSLLIVNFSYLSIDTYTYFRMQEYDMLLIFNSYIYVVTFYNIVIELHTTRMISEIK